MAELTKAMPIYDAILVLATDEERAVILAAGPRWELYDNSAWADEPRYQAALAAYAMIKQVLIRIVENPELRFTGTNRLRELSRGPLDSEDVVSGRLLWLRPDGRNSELFLDWTNPTIRIDNLQIEPVEPVGGAGKAVRSAQRSPPLSSPEVTTIKRPSEAAVRKWMEETVSAAVAAGRQPKRDGTLTECRAALNATHAQALAAWNALPPELKRARGQRGGV
ncbi:MAG: hypothetical protein NT133_09315 [Alphaproteobacteria bacterium]|nr:hypothetical protein [Alphaproteobacteria bacterium]